MIKALGKTAEGRALIILGLSRANMDKLAKDKPIQIDLAKDLGIEGGGIVLLVGGETEAAIQAQLERVITLPG